MSDDRRADARDRRLTDIDSTAPTGRDESKKVGRVRLDEIDWEDAEPRRVPYDEWLERGSRPFPAVRGRKDDWNDWPEMPTRIGEWEFRPYTTSNDYLAPAYVDRDSGGEWRRSIDAAETYVRMYDKREFGGGCVAFVVTPVVRVAAGSPPHPPIVEGDDPLTLVKRLASYLDGTPPSEITHPRYTPALERNLPDGWRFTELLPLQTKTTYSWQAAFPDVVGAPAGYAIDAEGSTNSRMDVFAYPVPSIGEKSPKTRPAELGIDVMPGDGPGPAAETARRMMRVINDDPAGFGVTRKGDDAPEPSAERERMFGIRSSEGDRIVFYEGDLVKAVYKDRFTDEIQTAIGRLRDVEMVDTTPQSTNTNEALEITFESEGGLIGDDGDVWTVLDRQVFLGDTNRGRLLRGNDQLYLVERGE
jgi:hypothetical protein